MPDTIMTKCPLSDMVSKIYKVRLTDTVHFLRKGTLVTGLSAGQGCNLTCTRVINISGLKKVEQEIPMRV